MNSITKILFRAKIEPNEASQPTIRIKYLGNVISICLVTCLIYN